MYCTAEFQFRDGKGRAIGGLSEPVSLENPMRIRVYRDEISRHLIEEAQRLHREAITFHFQASVTAVNFHKQVATVADSREVSQTSLPSLLQPEKVLSYLQFKFSLDNRDQAFCKYRIKVQYNRLLIWRETLQEGFLSTRHTCREIVIALAAKKVSLLQCFWIEAHLLGWIARNMMS